MNTLEETLIIGGQKYDWTEEFAWICWDCYTNRVFAILNKISDNCRVKKDSWDLEKPAQVTPEMASEGIH